MQAQSCGNFIMGVFVQELAYFPPFLGVIDAVNLLIIGFRLWLCQGAE